MDRKAIIDNLQIIATWAAVGKDPIYRGIEPKCCEDVEQWVMDAIDLLKEQEQIKSPDEFKSLLLGMFDSIWDVEIDHPIFQDTVGELMEGVLQAYRQAVKWE